MFSLLAPYPAAKIIEGKKKTLVIADPHLGWELSLQEKGIHLPSQTPKILKKLVNLLLEHKPNTLMIAGDIKYTVVSSELGEWQDIPAFFAELKKYVPEIGIIRGNHDANLEPMLPENVKMFPATGIVNGDCGLFHGHKWPSPALLGCKTLIMGHLHPVVVFHDPAGLRLTRQVWMRLECNSQIFAKLLLKKHGIKIEGTIEQTLQKHYNVRLKATQLFIMPSFNDFLGGRPLNESYSKEEKVPDSLIGPVLHSDVVNVAESELYLLDGTYLGTLRQLRQIQKS